MKRLLTLAALLLAALPAAHAAWQLTWSDEFDGSSIDSNHWRFETGNGAQGWGNHELENYTSRPENAVVNGGSLHIVARRETFEGFAYTSAKLKSRGLFFQKYGRFEFRARLPQGQGYWPALWMMPESATYGPWAASGEIDIVENKGSNPTNVMGTLHYGGQFPRNTHSRGPSFTFPSGDSVTNFHVYALEWTNNAIRWYVDDHLYETQTSWWSGSDAANPQTHNPFPAPFDLPF